MNGQAALEGTFLGPGVVMGRVAARALPTAQLEPRQPTSLTTLGTKQRALPPASTDTSQSCESCHAVRADVAQPKPGYWHYAQSHRVVLERGTACLTCHASLAPYRPETHRINRLTQSQTCAACHGAQEAGNLQNKMQETSDRH